jgi:hypothetical protein
MKLCVMGTLYSYNGTTHRYLDKVQARGVWQNEDDFHC